MGDAKFSLLTEILCKQAVDWETPVRYRTISVWKSANDIGKHWIDTVIERHVAIGILFFELPRIVNNLLIYWIRNLDSLEYFILQIFHIIQFNVNLAVTAEHELANLDFVNGSAHCSATVRNFVDPQHSRDYSSRMERLVVVECVEYLLNSHDLVVRGSYFLLLRCFRTFGLLQERFDCSLWTLIKHKVPARGEIKFEILA